MHPAAGLRALNDVDQLACFEFAACYSSQAVRDLIFGVQAGMTELEAVTLMKLSGLPQSCHRPDVFQRRTDASWNWRVHARAS